MIKNVKITIPLLVIAAGLLGFYVGTKHTTTNTTLLQQTPEERQTYIESLKANPKLTVTTIDDFRSVVGEAEFMQMFSAARSYIRKYNGSGMEFDLLFNWKKGDWIEFTVIPENVTTDNATLYLQKVNGKWIGYNFGTAFPELMEDHPELFSN